MKCGRFRSTSLPSPAHHVASKAPLPSSRLRVLFRTAGPAASPRLFLGPFPGHVQLEHPQFRLVLRWGNMADQQGHSQPNQHRRRRSQESYDYQPDLPQQPHDHGRGPGQFLERGGHGPAPALASTPTRATAMVTTSSFTVLTRFNSWTTKSPGATPTRSIGRWAPGTGSSSRRSTGPWRARCGRPGPPNRRAGCSSRRDGPTGREAPGAQRRFGPRECRQFHCLLRLGFGDDDQRPARYRQRRLRFDFALSHCRDKLSVGV